MATAAAVKAISKQRERGEVSDDIKNCTRRRKWRHKGEQRLLGIAKSKRRSTRMRVQLFMKCPGVKIKAM